VKLIDPSAGKSAKSAIVYNYMLINQINNMTLYAKDTAGHISTKKLRVISDFTPPMSPTFCVGESYSSCLPDFGLGIVESSAPSNNVVSEKVTICHVTSNETLSLDVGAAALQAHLNHGDTEGACV